MPYDSIDAAKSAGFPTSAEDADLTLAQINKLAEIYDVVKKAGTADNPMAVAWAQWKKLYQKQGTEWVKLSGVAGIPPKEGMTAATLSFASLDKVSEDPSGDTIFHDVTLIAEGTWTDGHSRTATHYGGDELEKMRFEKVTMKMDHDIFGQLPLTNEIGIIENPRFMRDPMAKWLGDVRIFPTQNGKDTATLLKRGKITDISSELFLKPILNSKTKTTQATNMVFMGAATVRQGACTVCKFNEGIDTMTDETNPAGGGEGTEPAGAAALSGDPDVAALEAELQEKKLAQSSQTATELTVAQTRIVELETTIKAQEIRMAALEKDTRVKDLQQQIATLSSQPVIHTMVGGAPTAAQAVELDTGAYEAFTVADFTEG